MRQTILTMINCIIIEDEPFARETLEEYIQRAPQLNLLGSFHNPLEALDFIDNDIDLIFSDIQMPEMDGISFFKTLTDPPKIIFITGHPGFAVEGFELDIVDYILKPYSFERFMKAVNKAKNSLKSSLSSNATFSKKDYIAIPDGHKSFIVLFKDIMYIEGTEDYVKIITPERNFLSKRTMKNMENTLSDNFARIQKSYIVNISYIESIGASEVTLKSSSGRLPIGLKYRDSFYQKVGVRR